MAHAFMLAIRSSKANLYCCSQVMRAAVQAAAVPKVDSSSSSSTSAGFGASKVPFSRLYSTSVQHSQHNLPQYQHTRSFSAAADGYQTASGSAACTSKQVQPGMSSFGTCGLKAWAVATAAGTAVILIGTMAEQGEAPAEAAQLAGQKGTESTSADAAPDKTGAPPAGMLPVRVAVAVGNTLGKQSPLPAQPTQDLRKAAPPSCGKQQWKPSEPLASAQPQAAAAGDKQARLLAINKIAGSIQSPLTDPSSSCQLQLQPKLSGSSAPQKTMAPATSLHQVAQISSSSGFSLPRPQASLQRIHPMLAGSADGLKGLSFLSSSDSSSDIAEDFIWAAASSHDVAAVDVAAVRSTASSSKVEQRLSDDNVAVADQRNSNHSTTANGRRMGARGAGRATKSPTAAVAARAAQFDAQHERERQAAAIQREQQQRYSSAAPFATGLDVGCSSFGPGAHFGACRPYEVVKTCRITGNSLVGTA